jgi:hypothetical protein
MAVGILYARECLVNMEESGEIVGTRLQRRRHNLQGRLRIELLPIHPITAAYIKKKKIKQNERFFYTWYFGLLLIVTLLCLPSMSLSEEFDEFGGYEGAGAPYWVG